MSGAPSLLARAARRVEHWFFAASDARAYAALRIGYAVASLGILIDLWGIRHNLFAESGLVGGGAGLSLTRGLNAFIWIRSEHGVSLYMIASALCLVLLALGIAPRLMAIAAYVWAVSYNSTAYYAASGYDELVRLIGFTLMISPTVDTWSLGRGWLAGQRWSGSAVGERTERPSGPPSYGLRLVQWQLFLVYFATVWLKVADDNWRDGDVIAYFWMSIFSRFPSPIYADWLWLSALLAWSTLAIELALPFLLWIPKTRIFALLLGVALHGGIAITGKLALFGLMIVPLYAAFFEAKEFDRLEAWGKRWLAIVRGERERKA